MRYNKRSIFRIDESVKPKRTSSPASDQSDDIENDGESDEAGEDVELDKVGTGSGEVDGVVEDELGADEFVHSEAGFGCVSEGGRWGLLLTCRDRMEVDK